MTSTPNESDLKRCLTGLAASALGRAGWRRVARTLKISPRQLQLVMGICNGDKRRAIARRLGISEHTVHGHERRLFEKLDVHRRSEVVTCVLITVAEMHRTRRKSRK